MIRDLALTVCISCILAGLLQALLPQGYYTKVINQLCALYILLSAFTALRGVSWGQLPLLAVSGGPNLSVTASLDLKNLLGAELAGRAESLLEQNGLKGRAVCTPQPDGSLLVEIEAESPGSEEDIRQLFGREWTEATPYRVGQGEARP